MEITIRDEFIKLGQALKLAGVVEDGVQAKYEIQDGNVKVNGEVWSAKTDDESSIAKGTEVEVLKIDGVKLVVSPIRVTSVL